MFSRLFKFGMVAGGRPPTYPHMATTRGDVFQYDAKTDAFTKLLTLNLGTTEPTRCQYSPDGKFLAYNNNNTNGHYFLFQRTSSGYAPVTLPGTFTESSYSVQWSKDGTYLFFGCSGGLLRWFKRNPDDTFTQLPSVTVSSSGTIGGIAISPDNHYVVVSYSASSYIATYKISSDTLVKFTGAQTPSYVADRLVFIDNTTLIYPQDGAAGPYQYKFDPTTDAVTRTVPSVFPNQREYSIAISKDGTHFAMGGASTLEQYKYDGTTITKLASPATLPLSSAYGLSYSPDDNYLACSAVGSPYVNVYKRVGDTLTKLADFAGVTQLATHDVSFAPAVNV